MTTSNAAAQPDALQAPSPPALDKRDWIAGLEKGLGIIECFDDANPRLTASQAGARCGMGCSCSIKTSNSGLVRCSKQEVFQTRAVCTPHP